MLIVIDNYDSFTYNLVHYLGELGASMQVYRNDKISVDEVIAAKPEAIVLSPGPCTPDDAGICLELVEKGGPQIPILGVCLGMQAMGQAYGGRVVRAQQLMHGKVSTITNAGKTLFENLPRQFDATRYHSLIVERSTLPQELEITAQDAGGTIMALSHRNLPVHGVQFHPESIASQHGHAILRNFLTLAKRWRERAQDLATA